MNSSTEGDVSTCYRWDTEHLTRFAPPAVQHSEQGAPGSPWVKAKPASLTLASSSLPTSLAARLIFSSWGANFQHAEGNTEFPCSAVPMFENQPCLRIHIFPPLVSTSTNRGFSSPFSIDTKSGTVLKVQHGQAESCQ